MVLKKNNNYRPEIDGLRAIAVIPVILFHAEIDFFKGGYLGVDIFFVISGYLITSIIYKEILEQKFSLLNFYNRRIRRIFPPLIITGFLTIFLASKFSPSDIQNVGQSFVATYTFLSNYFFYLETDYFNPFNQNTPLLHTWSLGVEEQFYIIFPFILIFLNYKFLNKYLILFFFCITSFFISLIYTNFNPSFSFYSFHTRAWELLIGCLVYFIIKDKKEYYFKSNLNNSILTFFFLIIIIVCFFKFDKNTSHPSHLTLLPTLCTAGILYYSNKSKIIVKFLSNKNLVLIGLISYPLYLYHNPIFSFIEYNYSNLNIIKLKVFSLPIIFILSYFSYKFVETPCRNLKLTKSYLIIPILISFCLVFIILGYYTHYKKGFLNYFNERLVSNGGVELVDVNYQIQLVEKTKQKYLTKKSFNCGNVSCKKILVIGDSFAQDIYLSLSVLEENKINVMKIFFDDECMNLKIFNNTSKCNKKIIDFSAINEADIIIISAKWQETTFKSGFNFARNILEQVNKKIFVVGSVMFEDMNSLAFKTQNLLNNKDAISKLVYSNLRFDRLKISDKLKKLIISDPDLLWIEKFDFFCTHKNKSCELFSDGKPLIWDNAHLTIDGYEKFGRFILEKITK